MPSTITDVQQAILDILGAHAGLTGVSIRPAALTETEDMPENGEIVYLGDVEVPEEDWDSLGGMGRREEYFVGIVIWCEQWGDDPMTVRVRAREMWEEVAEALWIDLRAPGGLIRAAGAYQFDTSRGRLSVAPVAPQKWGARYDRQVQFKAKFTP